MKRFKFTLTLAILLSSVLFFSCSKKDDVLVFPELIEKEFAPNSEGEFTFKAGADWALASSTAWCQFVDEDGELVQTLDGSYGDQTIKFKVNAIGASFDKVDLAEFTITMENQPKVIYKLTRTSKKYEIAVVNATGAAITATNPIVVAYDAVNTVSVNGNFEWAVTEKPEWLVFEGATNGASDVKVDLVASIAPNFTKAAQTGVVYIGSQADPKKYAFTVTYDGIPADKIEFSVSGRDIERYNFSADALSYFYFTHPDADGVKHNAPFPITVSARNDEYTVICLKKNNFGYDMLESDEKWFTVADDKKGKLSLTVSVNASKERLGAILVLPKAVALTLGGDMSKVLDKSDDSYWEIAAKYESFIALKVKQYGDVNGFTVVADGQPLTVVKVANAFATYGTDNVYTLTLAASKSYDEIVVRPKGLSAWESVQPETFWNGVNTKWSGVEIEGGYDPMEHTALINIWAVSANTTGVVRTITMGLTGDNYMGYLLIKQ